MRWILYSECLKQEAKRPDTFTTPTKNYIYDKKEQHFWIYDVVWCFDGKIRLKKIKNVHAFQIIAWLFRGPSRSSSVIPYVMIFLTHSDVIINDFNSVAISQISHTVLRTKQLWELTSSMNLPITCTDPETPHHCPVPFLLAACLPVKIINYNSNIINYF